MVPDNTTCAARTRRLLAALLAAAAIVFVVSACTQFSAEAYSDFMQNEDVLNRFEICFDDIEDGHAGAYTAGELRALREDLGYGYGLGDEEADNATRLFQEAASALEDAVADDAAEQSESYQKARELFAEAWAASVRARRGAYDE